MSKTKHRDMNKMASGGKDMLKSSTGKRDDDTKNKEVTFIILQKIWGQCTQVKKSKK